MLVLLLFALLFPRDAAPRLWVDQYAPLPHDGRMKGQVCVLTNGSHVYFWEDGPEGPTLEEVPVSGGESKALALQSGFVEIFDLSSKTSEFLVGSSTSDPDGHMLWTVSSRGGAPRRIGNLRVTDAKWSPDEKQIAFTSNRELYIASADGKIGRKLATCYERTFWGCTNTIEHDLLFSASGYAMLFDLARYRSFTKASDSSAAHYLKDTKKVVDMHFNFVTDADNQWLLIKLTAHAAERRAQVLASKLSAKHNPMGERSTLGRM